MGQLAVEEGGQREKDEGREIGGARRKKEEEKKKVGPIRSVRFKIPEI